MATEPQYVVVARSLDEDAERRELPTDQYNKLGCQTLEKAFPGAHGLKYKNTKTGAFRTLLVDFTGTKFSQPSDGWANKVFVVIPQNEQAVIERPPTPVEVDTVSQEQCKDDAQIKLMKKHTILFRLNSITGSGVVLDNRYIATCLHVIRGEFPMNANEKDDKYLNRINKIDINLQTGDEKNCVANLVYFDAQTDIALLYSNEEIEEIQPVIFSPASIGRKYFITGIPAVDEAKINPVQVLYGRITTVEPKYNILHGSSGSRRGGSGGPVFAYSLTYKSHQLILYGIVQRAPEITNGSNLGKMVEATYVRIIPSNFIELCYDKVQGRSFEAFKSNL